MATAHPFPVFIVKKFRLEQGSVKIHNHGLVFRRGEERWIYTKIVNMSTFLHVEMVYTTTHWLSQLAATTGRSFCLRMKCGNAFGINRMRKSSFKQCMKNQRGWEGAASSGWALPQVQGKVLEVGILLEVEVQGLHGMAVSWAPWAVGAPRLSLSLGEAAQAVFLLGTYSFCRPDRAYSCHGVTSGLGPPTQAGQGKQVLGPQRGRLWGNWGDTSTLDHNTTSTGSLGRAWAESPGGHQQQERNNHYPLGQERGCGHWRGC